MSRSAGASIRAALGTVHLVAMLVAAGGCGTGSKHAEQRADDGAALASVPVPDDIAADTLARIERLGGGASIIFVVDPTADAWGPFSKRLVEAGPVVEPFFSDHPAGPIGSILSVLDIEMAATELAGWDRRRRLVAGLSDPGISGPPGLPTMSVVAPPRAGLRHYLLIPALDSQQLVASLEAALGTTGEPLPALVDGIEGAKAWKRHDGVLALIPEESEVRVVAITAAFGAEHESDPAGWKSELYDADPVVRTPALSFLAQAEHTYASYWRNWRMRAGGVVYGSWAAHDSVRDLPPAYRMSAMKRGFDIMFMCEEFTGGARELDDWTIGAHLDGDTLLGAAVAGLTPHGREVVRGDGPRPVPLAVANDDLGARLFVQLPAHAVDDFRDRTRVLAESWKCGSKGLTELVTGSPIEWALPASAAAISKTELAPAEVRGSFDQIGEFLDHRPVAFQAAAGGENYGHLAMALWFADPAHAKSVLDKAGDIGLTAAPLTQGGYHVVALGTEDPLATFGAAKAEDAGPFASLTLEGPSSSSSTGELFHRGVIDVVDGLVVGSFAQSPTPVTPAPLPQPLKIAWDSPVHEPPAEQLECLRRAERTLLRAARELHDPETRIAVELVNRWDEQSADDLACALRGQTKDAAIAVLTYTLIASTNALNAVGESKAVATLTEDWCARQVDDSLCRLSARYESRPLAALPRVSLADPCLDRTRPGPTALAVTIAGGEVSINGTPIPFASDGQAALDRHLPADRDDLPVDVFADAQEPASLVLSVVDGLAAAKLDEIWLGSMDRDAGYAGIRLTPDESGQPRKASSPEMTWQAYMDATARRCGGGGRERGRQ